MLHFIQLSWQLVNPLGWGQGQVEAHLLESNVFLITVSGTRKEEELDTVVQEWRSKLVVSIPLKSILSQNFGTVRG